MIAVYDSFTILFSCTFCQYNDPLSSLVIFFVCDYILLDIENTSPDFFLVNICMTISLIHLLLSTLTLFSNITDDILLELFFVFSLSYSLIGEFNFIFITTWGIISVILFDIFPLMSFIFIYFGQHSSC